MNKIKSIPSLFNKFLPMAGYGGLLLCLMVWKMVSLSYICLLYTFTRTILYTVHDEEDYEPNRVVNSWLIYCFTYTVESMLNTLFYGSLYFITKVVLTVFVLDMMFLKDTSNNTFSVVLYDMLKSVFNKYMDKLHLKNINELVETFETDIYPKYRMSIYNSIMNRLFPTKNKKVRSKSDNKLDTFIENKVEKSKDN
jgi:hypothetical protein